MGAIGDRMENDLERPCDLNIFSFVFEIQEAAAWDPNDRDKHDGGFDWSCDPSPFGRGGALGSTTGFS